MIQHTIPRIAVLAFALLIAMGVPSGRPPNPPLQREKPQIYDVSFGAQIRTLDQTDVLARGSYNLTDAPIVLPIIFKSAYSKVDPDSLTAQLWLDGHEDETVQSRARTDDGLPFHAHLAVLTVPRFSGREVRWRITYRAQTWNSRIDDAAAAKIAWPKEWPTEVKDGLEPQMYIESDDEVFKRAVADASGGQLRFVPPYLAAKDLIRYCIRHVKVTRGGTVEGRARSLAGMQITGALAAAKAGKGSPHDLVCVCVATLRAADIPARPVVGFHYDRRQKRFDFISWGEFYLPGAGWVPFDPNELRGNGAMQREVRQPWIDLGTMDRLNERIPLAFHYLPPTLVESPIAPGVWGWDPRPGGDPSSTVVLTISSAHKGKGTEDPH